MPACMYVCTIWQSVFVRWRKCCFGYLFSPLLCSFLLPKRGRCTRCSRFLRANPHGLLHVVIVMYHPQNPAESTTSPEIQHLRCTSLAQPPCPARVLNRTARQSSLCVWSRKTLSSCRRGWISSILGHGFFPADQGWSGRKGIFFDQNKGISTFFWFKPRKVEDNSTRFLCFL